MTNGGGAIPQSLNPAYDANLNIPKLGAEYENGVWSGYLNGKIDAFSTWTKELSQDEVTQLYNSGTGAQYPFTGTFSSAINQLGVDNGTLINGCYLSDGKIGKAFTFDGVNDYVSLPNNSLNFTGDFSIGLWVYFNSLNNPNSQWNQQFIFSNNPIGLGNGFSLYKHSNNSLYFIISNGSSTTFFRAPQTLSQSTWYHIVITRKYGTTTKIFINGSEQTDAYYYSGNSSTNPTYLANQVVNLSGWGNAGGDLLNGKIDAFTTWQKELTQAEVTELYNSGNGKQITTTPIVQTGLVLNLDASRKSSYSGSGTTWTDISGNSNNGTLVNGPVFGTANGGVMNFDGVNDYVDLGTKSSLAPGTTDFTISFWINPNNWGSLSSTSYSPIFVTLVNGGLWIGKNGANFVLRTAYIADDVQYSVLPTVNQWTMVTVNRVGNIAKIYYNGSVVASATVTRNYVSGNSYLATDIPSNGNFSNIKLSTFSYYNRGLSELEITQNFNSTKGRFGL